MNQLTDAVFEVNDEVVGYVPNTLKYTEGFGEQTSRPVSVGGGKTEQVPSRNLESSMSKVMVELHVTSENIALARRWKANFDANVISITAKPSTGKSVARTFTQAVLTGDYEVEFGSDTNISLEFMTNAAI